MSTNIKPAKLRGNWRCPLGLPASKTPSSWPPLDFWNPRCITFQPHFWFAWYPVRDSHFRRRWFWMRTVVRTFLPGGRVDHEDTDYYPSQG